MAVWGGTCWLNAVVQQQRWLEVNGTVDCRLHISMVVTL